MGDNDMKAVFRYGPSGLEIEGSEDFVEMLIERLEVAEMIQSKGLITAGTAALEGEEDGDEHVMLPGPEKTSNFAEFDEVYAEAGDSFTIIADVDENTIAKSARNYMLLHLYGAYLLGRTEIGDDELRAVCTDHACYDPGNFAHHVKGMGSKVVRIGTSRSYNLKLTAPGIRHAKKFAEETQKRAMG